MDLAAFKEAIVGKNLVDVRKPEEVNDTGVVKGAKHINFMADDFMSNMEAAFGANKEQEIYVYCRSGARSGKAVVALTEAGFTHVKDMAGGTNAWSAAGEELVPLAE